MSVVLCLSKSEDAKRKAHELAKYHPFVATTQRDLLTFLKISIKPTIILLELSIYKQDIQSLVNYMQELYKDSVKIIAIVEKNDKNEAKELFDIGILGYIQMNAKQNLLHECLDAVKENKKWEQKESIQPKLPAIFLSLKPKKKEKTEEIIKPVKITQALYSGNYSEYEIKPSTLMEEAYIITDTVKKRDGSDFIYGDVTELCFTDVTISLSALKDWLKEEVVETKEETKNNSIPCISLKIFDEIDLGGKWEKVSLHVENYNEKEDHIYFEIKDIPENVVYSYSVGDNGLNISFKGKTKAKNYISLLTSLSYENSTSSKTEERRIIHINIDDSISLQTDINIEDDTI